MRVLQLGKYYEPHVGGIETHLGLLAEGLTARGVDVEVLVHGNGTRTVRERLRGISVTRVGAVGRLMSTELSPAMVTELGRSYDVLHLHTPHPMAMLAYRAARKPDHSLVITHHSDIVRQARLRNLLQPLFRSVLSRADAVIATSARYVDSSDELRPYRTKVRVVPYGIDLERFSPALRSSPLARELRHRYGERIVLSTGRLIYYKGFDVLLDAMQEVRGHLLLVGDGPLRRSLEERSRRNGVDRRVTFVGTVPNHEMGRFYGAANLFVLPSVARSEAFGIVQVEAMASALPVVNTDLASGVPEVSVHGSTGLTVPPQNPRALADALNQLLDEPDLASRLGAEGRRRATELFRTERMLEETLGIYREVTRKRVEPATRAGAG